MAASEGLRAASRPVPLLRYLEVLRDRWRVVLIVSVVITAGVTVGTFRKEAVYRAAGSIEIRKQAAELTPVDALFQHERLSDQYLQTEYGMLRSRVLVERTLADRALAARLWSATRHGQYAFTASPAQMRRLVNHVHERMSVDPVAGSRIVRIGYESSDPHIAADMASALIAQYIAMRNEAGSEAYVRLDEQLDSVRASLLAAEDDLKRFVRVSGLSTVVVGGPAGGTVLQERLRALQQELTEAETDSYRAAALSGTAFALGSAAAESELLQNLRKRIAEIEGEYARLQPTFTDKYPRMQQLRAELALLDSMVLAEQRRLGHALSAQHAVMQRRRELLEEAVAEQRRMLESLASNLAEYDRRRREIESLKELYENLQHKQQEASVSATLSALGIAVLDRAQPPESPVRPKPGRDIPLGALTGVLLGIGLAFLREYTDSTLKTPAQLDALVSKPLLAMIPAASIAGGSTGLAPRGSRRGKVWHRIDDASSGQDVLLAEAFRGLRTSILYDNGGRMPRSVLVTSSRPDEGKTTVCANLAISLGMLNRRVMLVDADMRKPSLHRIFAVPAAPGLSDCLADRGNWLSRVHHNVATGVDLLPAGGDPGNPSDLLSGAVMRAWLDEVSQLYDFVILDAPALFVNVPDARILSHAVDGVLLVVHSGSAEREMVARVAAHTPNVFGIVLNRLDTRRLPDYYAGYGERPASRERPAAADHARTVSPGVAATPGRSSVNLARSGD